MTERACIHCPNCDFHLAYVDEVTIPLEHVAGVCSSCCSPMISGADGKFHVPTQEQIEALPPQGRMELQRSIAEARFNRVLLCIGVEPGQVVVVSNDMANFRPGKSRAVEVKPGHPAKRPVPRYNAHGAPVH